MILANGPRSPGLVPMGGDSYSKGCEFGSRHCILDGHFLHLFVLQLQCVFGKTKINEKEAGVGPFKKEEGVLHLSEINSVEFSILFHRILQ